jgi:hypothetical protein
MERTTKARRKGRRSVVAMVRFLSLCVAMCKDM